MTNLTEKIAMLPEVIKQGAETDHEWFDFAANCAVYKHNCDALAARNALLCEALGRFTCHDMCCSTLTGGGPCDCGARGRSRPLDHPA